MLTVFTITTTDTTATTPVGMEIEWRCVRGVRGGDRLGRIV
jgi:hypothetical protein